MELIQDQTFLQRLAHYITKEISWQQVFGPPSMVTMDTLAFAPALHQFTDVNLSGTS